MVGGDRSKAAPWQHVGVEKGMGDSAGAPWWQWRGPGQTCSVETGRVEGGGAAELFCRDGKGRNEVGSRRLR